MNWQSDYESFVGSIVKDHNLGLNSEELSQKYGNFEVEWEGKIQSIELDKEYVPRVVLEMPQFANSINGGFVLDTTYLSVGVDEKNRNSWKDSRVGESVRFKANTIVSNAIFPGIEVSLFDEEKSGYISLGIRNGAKCS